MIDAFTWFDIIVIALTLLLGVKGIMNGFVKEVFGLVGLIGGVILASRYASDAGVIISENLYKLNDSSAFFFGFLATLLVFWVACLGLGKIVAKLLDASGLGLFDKILGFFVGSAKIFLVFAIFCAIISNITILSEKFEPYFEKSKVYPLLLASGKFIMNLDINAAQVDSAAGIRNMVDSNLSVEANATTPSENNATKEGQ